MKQRKKVHYKNPPIIEAVFEVFFPKSSAWSQTVKDQILSTLKKEVSFSFGKTEEILFHSIDLNVQNSGPIQTKENEPIPRVRCWSEDKTLMFQFGPDMIAVNALPVYKSIEDYLPLLEKVTDRIFNTLGVKTVSHVGQRFINEITPSAEMPPDKIFAIYPKLPEQVRSQHPPFALQVETLRDANKTIALNLEYKGAQGDGHKYVLDIYLRSLNFSPKSSKDITSWMLSEHDNAVHTFESALTPDGQLFCGKESDERIKSDISK